MSDVEMGDVPDGVWPALQQITAQKDSLIDFIYDPDQDPEEKRAVRKNYRSLAKTVEGASSFRHLYPCANMEF